MKMSSINNNIHLINNNLETTLKPLIGNSAYLVIIDYNVKYLYPDYLNQIILNAQEVITINSTESNKSEASINMIHQVFFDNQVDRQTTIIACGGGIITDLVGYAAATYLRGLPLISIPTTVMAMMDSSIGGKVGVNKYGIKNLIGTFYDAQDIIIDLSFLKTLTSRLFSEGLVEIIKCGLISNHEIIDALTKIKDITELRNNEALVAYLIKEAINIKLNIIKDDYLDHHHRHFLNYGHSIAHCIELDYDIYHGEALAFGLLINLMSNDNVCIFNTIKAILTKFNTLRVINDIDFNKIKQDKKRNKQIIKEIFIDNNFQPYLKEVNINNLILQYEKTYHKIKNTLPMKATQFYFYPSLLQGEVKILPAKSYVHRYLLAAFLAKDITVLKNITGLNDDMLTTIKALKAFNMHITYQNNELIIDATKIRTLENITLNMHESASSLRILLPTLMAYAHNLTITGENNLVNRPLDVYLKLFKEQDITFHKEASTLPISISGSFKASHYTIDGSVSSQFLSGLLFYLPTLNETSVISIKNKQVSKPYLDLTLQVLKEFNIKIINMNYQQFIIKPQQTYQSQKEYNLELDYSSYLNFEILKRYNPDLILPPKQPSLQADSYIIDKIINKTTIYDLTNYIDSAPLLALILAQQGGKLININPLQYKESNRLDAIIDLLTNLKIGYELKDNELLIKPSQPQGHTFNTYHDHRIALAIIIAGNIFKIPVVINEITSINKSISHFLELFIKLKGVYDEK